MSTWRQRFVGGPDKGESREDYVRRLNRSRLSGYVAPVLPSVVELYDRITALENRVRELESR